MPDRCLFFKYCWVEGIKLLTEGNYPECNGAYNNNSSSKMVFFNNRRPVTGDQCEFSNQRISVHQRLGGKASIHDRLGARPVFMIGLEAESMKSQMIGWKR
jgi:hypothetical protein